jgi:enoyl-CoA hydratase
MELHRDGDVALLRMSSGKANAIGPAFLARLGALLDDLRDARALVFIGQPGFFSAGLDLPSLIELDQRAMAAFIDSFGETMLRVFELPLPVVAAVNGHAIAGGCVLALQADHRVMGDDPKARIGLNEVQLGIGLPPVVMETLRLQVPPTSIPTIALEGRLSTAVEALGLGLVHELAPPAHLEERALGKARSMSKLAGSAFRQIKKAYRAPAVAAVRAASTDVESWTSTWFSEGGQQLLRAAVDRLKKKA